MTTPQEQVRQPQRVLYDLKARYLGVLKVHRLSLRMVRVTLGGEDLEGFTCAAPADHVRLFFPRDREDRPAMPTVNEEGHLERPSAGRRPIHRDYTIRRYNSEAAELDIDFVIHGAGPASSWAEQARPGQVLGVLGPRGSKLVPYAFDWYLLGGDETALPAIGRWLEHLPPGARTIVIVEVADAREEQELATTADADITWLHRDDAAAGTTGMLARAMRELQPLDGDFFTWVAGEAGSIQPVRRYLRDELGVRPDWIDVDGYWKRGVANLEPHATDEEANAAALQHGPPRNGPRGGRWT